MSKKKTCVDMDQVLTDTEEKAKQLSDIAYKEKPDKGAFMADCASRMKAMIRLIKSYESNFESWVSAFTKVTSENKDLHYKVALYESVLLKETVEAVNALCKARSGLDDAR